MANRLLAARVFGTPLLIASKKLDVILSVLGPRLGLDLPAPAPGPEAEAKAARSPGIDGYRSPDVHESRIAVLPVVGTLANRVSSLDAESGLCGYQDMAAQIDALAGDPTVDAILLEVDSFGGEAAGCFDLADRIHAAAKKKPIYGVADQYAMSGGYALLSQCAKVFIPQSGEVGSIGVVTSHVDMTAAAEKEGVKVTLVHAGARKVDLSPWKALSADARARLEGEVAQLYDQFLGVVSRGRGSALTVEAARATEATTFIGQAAVDAGLADEVGTKADALAALHAEVVEAKRMKDLQQKNAALEAEVATLKQQVAARLAADDAAYLESLAKRSADAQAPIDAAKLAQVKAHIDAGRREFARELGDAYLEAAVGKGGKPFSAKEPAGPPAANEHEAGAERGLKRLRERGAKYERRIARAQNRKG